jgi:hypothetical protein
MKNIIDWCKEVYSAHSRIKELTEEVESLEDMLYNLCDSSDGGWREGKP